MNCMLTRDKTDKTKLIQSNWPWSTENKTVRMTVYSKQRRSTEKVLIMFTLILIAIFTGRSEKEGKNYYSKVDTRMGVEITGIP